MLAQKPAGEEDGSENVLRMRYSLLLFTPVLLRFPLTISGHSRGQTR